VNLERGYEYYLKGELTGVCTMVYTAVQEEYQMKQRTTKSATLEPERDVICVICREKPAMLREQVMVVGDPRTLDVTMATKKMRLCGDCATILPINEEEFDHCWAEIEGASYSVYSFYEVWLQYEDNPKLPSLDEQ
jgi:hypothetical protein